ncbi:type ISP restriction/modification enzyme, partial [Geminocystis sp. GBBB08]|uniref:type ISP restriction/modification enzyme n=1 Tax=Geminocystis sp. GBBB08 TaxID=2604140 RepID=UPI0027E2A90A
PEIKDFRQAINTFSQDLPTILDTLRNLIDSQDTLNSDTSGKGLKPIVTNSGKPIVTNSGGDKPNQKFIEARDKFLKVCQESINPDIKIADIREMIVQHILTEDIFTNIFSDAQFHLENNIAKQLNEVIKTFFTGNVKKNTFKTIQSYYNAIIRTASSIVNHQEKQKFLKVVYENFYKAYNPKEADRLGIVYTPNEIVKFMVQSTDYLLNKHFTRGLSPLSLGDKGVEILDPCTGTGTFITEILDYLLTRNVEYKYQNEIHCNEMSILPYYIANLNIEYTYQQKTGEYLEFNNICLVDTLHPTDKGEKQMNLFSMNEENTDRIKRQNEKKISVIIGNPPYNAKQENFNDNNANRKYETIDKRIKDSYIKEGTAQNQIVVYDMYTRFIRWATDRLNEEGIIAFISNSSFIDGRAFDGLRKCLEEEFDYIYIIDLGGNIRAGDKTGNVFNIMVGVVITFFVKNPEKDKKNCQTYYYKLNENSGKDKLDFLTKNKLSKIKFNLIVPDKKHNWINQTDNDFDDLIPLIDKDVKAGKTKAVKNNETGELENKVSEEAIFQLFSRGVTTQRDKWVYDISKENLEAKVKFLINTYQATLKDSNYQDKDKIKWDAELTSYAKREIEKEFNSQQIIKSNYRPFYRQYLYFDKHFNGRTYQWFNIYNQDNLDNKYIALLTLGATKSFHCLGSNILIDLHFTGDSQCLPLYRYEKGERLENITDWALEKFRECYYNVKRASSLSGSNRQDACLTGEENKINNIEKEDIFHYVYGVLHNPKYRKKYELNLKHEFPRIPFYDDFWRWANWGKQLMDLHLNYETIKPYNLKRIDVSVTRGLSALPEIKVKLKADKVNHKIIIDEVTTLTKIPTLAWEYELGNRSAIEWILDQYKEKKPKDKTIAKKFDNYKFADYKEEVIELLKKIITVSVETMIIINQMN